MSSGNKKNTMMPQRLAVKYLFFHGHCCHGEFLLFLIIPVRIQQQKPAQGPRRSSVPINLVKLSGKNPCWSFFFKVTDLQVEERERGGRESSFKTTVIILNRKCKKNEKHTRVKI